MDVLFLSSREMVVFSDFYSISSHIFHISMNRPMFKSMLDFRGGSAQISLMLCIHRSDLVQPTGSSWMVVIPTASSGACWLLPNLICSGGVAIRDD